MFAVGWNGCDNYGIWMNLGENVLIEYKDNMSIQLKAYFNTEVIATIKEAGLVSIYVPYYEETSGLSPDNF